MFRANAELYQEYENIWDNFPGDDFEKALELFRDYSGYNDFWAIRKGRNYAKPVSEVIAGYYGDEGYLVKYRNSLLCDLKCLVFQINEVIFLSAEKRLDVTGHLFAVFSVIEKKTGINYFDYSHHSYDRELFDFYRYYLINYFKYSDPACNSYETVLLENVSWIAKGEVPFHSMLCEKMINRHSIIKIVKAAILHEAGVNNRKINYYKLISHCVTHLNIICHKDVVVISKLFKFSLDEKALKSAQSIFGHYTEKEEYPILSKEYHLKVRLLHHLVEYHNSIGTDTSFRNKWIVPEKHDAREIVRICFLKSSSNALIIFLYDLDFRDKLRASLSKSPEKFIQFIDNHYYHPELLCLLFSSIWGAATFLDLICPHLDQIKSGLGILVTTLKMICDAKHSIDDGSKPYPVTDRKYFYFDQNDAYELLCQKNQSIANWQEVEACFIKYMKPDFLHTLMLAVDKFSLPTIKYLLSTKKINTRSHRFAIYDDYHIQKLFRKLSLLQAPILKLICKSRDYPDETYQHTKEMLSLLIKYDRNLLEVKDSNGKDLDHYIKELKEAVAKKGNGKRIALVNEIEKIIAMEKFYCRARIFFFAGNADTQSNVYQELTRDVGTVIMDMSRKLYKLG